MVNKQASVDKFVASRDAFLIGAMFGGQKTGMDQLEDKAVSEDYRRIAYRMNDEMRSYMAEIASQLKEVVDDEERSVLVSNAIEEISDNIINVATDVDGSRVLESLMAEATTAQQIQFLDWQDSEALFSVAKNCFGSHVVETVLKCLDAKALPQSDNQAWEETVRSMVKLMEPDLLDYITNKNATHVARQLLCIAAGRDVVPSSGSSGSTSKNAKKGRKRAQQLRGLEAKLKPMPDSDRRGDARGRQPRMPALVHSLVQAYQSGCGSALRMDQLQELACDQYASPFVQGLLLAAAYDEALVQPLVPTVLGALLVEADWVERLKALKARHVTQMMEDRVGSRLLEAVLEAAPPRLLQLLWQRFLKGRIAELAVHPCANFPLQTALSALSTADQVEMALDKLEPLFPQLLRESRAGIVAALLSACERCGDGAAQRRAAAALLAAFPGAGEEAEDGSSGAAALAHLLLLRPTGTRSSGSMGSRPLSCLPQERLAVLGCVMASTVLRFGKEARQPLACALAQLEREDLALVALDSAGSRVVQAALEAGAASKQERSALLARMEGGLHRLAVQPAGSRLVEAAFAVADFRGKERIVKELVQHERELGASNYAALVWQRCSCDAFKQSKKEWRRTMEAGKKLVAEYEALVHRSSRDASTSKASKHKPKSRTADPDVAQAQFDAATSSGVGECASDVTAAVSPTNKRRRGSPARSSAAGVEESEPPKAKKKKKKQKDKGAGRGASAQRAAMRLLLRGSGLD